MLGVTIVGTVVISSTPAGADSRLLGYLQPNVVFMAVSVFLMMKQIFEENEFSEQVRKVIAGLSDLCLGIYMIHTFVQNKLTDVGLTSVSFHGLFSVPVITIIIFICSMICCYLISKVPVMKKYML